MKTIAFLLVTLAIFCSLDGIQANVVPKLEVIQAKDTEVVVPILPIFKEPTPDPVQPLEILKQRELPVPKIEPL